MKPMDEKQTERVWSRVMCAQPTVEPSCAAAESEPPAQPGASLNDSALSEMVRRELQDAVTYRTLACMASGCAKQQLLRLAQEERCHAGKLAALYYLRTGRKVCPDGVKKPCPACLSEALRQRWQQEQETAKTYGMLACGEDTEIFRCLARQEAQHARTLLCVLENLLQRT